jgi:hypothetical protein
LKPKPTVQKLRAQIARLALAVNDFDEALSYLQARPAEDATVMRRALLTAAIVAYARPFTQNESNPASAATPTVSLKLPQLLSKEQLQLHKALLLYRNKAIAHAEHALRPVFYPGNQSSGSLIYGWLNFDVLAESIDRPLMAASCVTLRQEAHQRIGELTEALAHAKNAA